MLRNLTCGPCKVMSLRTGHVRFCTIPSSALECKPHVHYIKLDSFNDITRSLSDDSSGLSIYNKYYITVFIQHWMLFYTIQ